MEPNNFGELTRGSRKTTWLLLIIAIFVVLDIWMLVAINQSKSQTVETHIPKDATQAILDAIQASSSPNLSAQEMNKVLGSIQSNGATTPTDAQRQDILNAIKAQ